MKILFTVSDLLHQDLLKECERLRITKSEYIRKAIRNELYGTEASPEEKPKEIRLPKGVVAQHKEGVYEEKNPYSTISPYQSKSLGTPMDKPIAKPENTVVVNIHSPEEAIKVMSENMNTGKLCEHGAAPGLCQFGCK